MLLQIITTPNPILLTKAKPLTKEGILRLKTQKFIVDLIETMYKSDGVGLAAPQVSESIQICVIAKNFTMKQEKDLILINPIVKKKSLLKEWGDEGCLSVPNIFGKVKRYKKIIVEAQNEKGERIKFTASEFPARVIQHEVDHLNGILFIEKAKGLYKVEKKDLLSPPCEGGE